MALVKASPLGIVAFDLDGKILLWNRAAEEITGWREKEVLGLPIGGLADEKWDEDEALRRRTLNQEVFSKCGFWELPTPSRLSFFKRGYQRE